MAVPMQPVVTQNRHLGRFEIEVSGSICFLEYSDQDGVLIFKHTFVPPVLRNQGLAGLLTKFALETAGREKKKVDPQCSYAEAYLTLHPEYAHLRVG